MGSASGTGQGGGRLSASHRTHRSRVQIRAQFAVGEYDVVVLSSQDASALETWLRQHKYNLPQRAAALLQPYVQEGMNFFVAKVNAKKATIKHGKAILSPLRFHYEDQKFRLPIRLGLINAKTKQDLVVHILAPAQRYEAANRANVTIPTNLDVIGETRRHFPSFYSKLLDRTLAENPGAAVTEYSWSARQCDPCPTPPLNEQEIATLGGDVIPAAGRTAQRRFSRSLVVTRLHLRYDRDSPTDDLVFRPATPIAGGREGGGDWRKLPRAPFPSRVNAFQARYAIRHKWTKALTCNDPVHGRWSGRPQRPARAASRVSKTNTTHTPLFMFFSQTDDRVAFQRAAQIKCGDRSSYPQWLRDTLGPLVDWLGNKTCEEHALSPKTR